MILGYKWTNFREIFPFQKKKKEKQVFVKNSVNNCIQYVNNIYLFLYFTRMEFYYSQRILIKKLRHDNY